MFRQLRKVAKARGLDELFVEAIRETSDQLLDLLRAQMQSGQDQFGQMPKYASKVYASKKQAMGSKAPFGVVDLKLTGSFQDKLFLTITKTGLRIRSKDKKSNLLRIKYGNEIFVLNNENFGFYIDEILYPKLMQIVENELL